MIASRTCKTLDAENDIKYFLLTKHVKDLDRICEKDLTESVGAVQ